MPSNIPQPAPATPLDAYVAALLAIHGQLAGVIDHMMAFQASGRSAPDAPPIPVVLAGLLTDILAPLAGDDGRTDLEVAARLLEAASDLIGSELLLVNPDVPEDSGDEGWLEAG